MTGKDIIDERPGLHRGEGQEETQELALKTQPHRSGECGVGVPEGTPQDEPACPASAESRPRPADGTVTGPEEGGGSHLESSIPAIPHTDPPGNRVLEKVFPAVAERALHRSIVGRDRVLESIRLLRKGGCGARGL